MRRATDTDAIRLHGPGCACGGGSSRRDFLSRSLGCAGFLALSLSGLSGTAQRAWAAEGAARASGTTVATTPFARVEKIVDGVWAIVSTPWDNPADIQRQTLSNGGIIAGKDGVMVVEAFNQPVGAAWVSDMAELLTGRRPTHVVVTHFHADHTGGLAGFRRGAEGPDIVATKVTRDLAIERNTATVPPKEGEPAPDLSPTRMQIVTPNRIMTDPVKPVRIDLGGRVVNLVPRGGHTDSDVTIEIEDPRVIFTGDLVFNRIFPFYGDSTPSRWNATCETLLSEAGALYVPGHGNLAGKPEMDTYRELLGLVGVAATAAHKAGTSAEAAAAAFKIPDRLGEWFQFSPRVFAFAFDAWYRELGA